jgi:outer membrane protein assembly factor BamB
MPPCAKTGWTMRIHALLAVTTLAIGCSDVQEFQLPAGPDNGSQGPSTADGNPVCGTDSDPKNCGVCGHSCLGGACAAGACAPVRLASGQGDSAYGVPWYSYTTDIGDPLVGPDRLAVDDTHVYWLNLRGEVMRVPIAGGDAERIAKTTAAPAWIDLDAQFVYFSTLGAELFRVPKSGGTPVQLAPKVSAPRSGMTLLSSPSPFEFMLAAGQIYFANGNGIYACPSSGCLVAPTPIDEVYSDSVPFSFAIDATGRMYASESNTSDYAMTVFREGQWLGLSSPSAYYELKGGASEVYTLTTSDFGPTGIVRWSESSVTFLASGDTLSGAPRGLTLDDDYVYWANAGENKIDRLARTASVVRCKKTGCAAPEVLAGAQLTPRAVAVSKGVVYWTTGDGSVMKLAKPVAPGQRPLK